MKYDTVINLEDVLVSSESGEMVIEAAIPDDLDNPIVLLRTNFDRKGARFDLRKAMLLKDGHDFDRDALRKVSLVIQQRRMGMTGSASGRLAIPGEMGSMSAVCA